MIYYQEILKTDSEHNTVYEVYTRNEPGHRYKVLIIENRGKPYECRYLIDGNSNIKIRYKSIRSGLEYFNISGDLAFSLYDLITAYHKADGRVLYSTKWYELLPDKERG